ncbi:MAG TPA: formate dehydrogenase accessory protein FdhE [Bryobacteraceae bacterium]|jgi:FdhE protein|nr:formate dehydrogenase accessory protein FdhE [Bryobacteraceae bacterium]
MMRSKWDQRIRRADELAAGHPYAAEVLRFYGHVARFQKDLYAGLPGTGADLHLLLPKFPGFLDHIAAVAPEPLAQCAGDLKNREPADLLGALTSFWGAASEFQPGPGRAAELLACIFLQPYAEYQADHGKPAPPREIFGRCPFCSARPVAGVLRPEGDGAKRSLICSFCSTEWNIGRIVCPACAEETVEKLAVYTSDQFPHVRVEACDSCRYYIKTVDLSKNGHAVPVVDELTAIPLDLWAQQHEYVKLHANMLGM